MTTHTTFEAGMPESAQKLMLKYAQQIGEALLDGKDHFKDGHFVVSINTDISMVVALSVESVRKAMVNYPHQNTVDIICEACPPESVRVFFWNGVDDRIFTVRAYYSAIPQADTFPMGMLSKHKGSA